MPTLALLRTLCSFPGAFPRAPNALRIVADVLSSRFPARSGVGSPPRGVPCRRPAREFARQKHEHPSVIVDREPRGEQGLRNTRRFTECHSETCHTHHQRYITH